MEQKSGNHLHETTEKRESVCVCQCVIFLMTPQCYLWRRNEVEEIAKDSKNHDGDAKCVRHVCESVFACASLHVCVCVCVFICVIAVSLVREQRGERKEKRG